MPLSLGVEFPTGDSTATSDVYGRAVPLDSHDKILLVSGNGETPLDGGQLIKALDRLLPSAAPRGS